jgi:hypothetical protein
MSLECWQRNVGAYIYLQTQGFRHGPADVLAKVALGEVVDLHPVLFQGSRAV